MFKKGDKVRLKSETNTGYGYVKKGKSYIVEQVYDDDRFKIKGIHYKGYQIKFFEKTHRLTRKPHRTSLP